MALNILNELKEKYKLGSIAFDLTKGQRNNIEFDERKEHYYNSCHHVIDCTKLSISQVANKIIKIVN